MDVRHKGGRKKQQKRLGNGKGTIKGKERRM